LPRTPFLPHEIELSRTLWCSSPVFSASRPFFPLTPLLRSPGGGRLRGRRFSNSPFLAGPLFFHVFLVWFPKTPARCLVCFFLGWEFSCTRRLVLAGFFSYPLSSSSFVLSFCSPLQTVPSAGYVIPELGFLTWAFFGANMFFRRGSVPFRNRRVTPLCSNFLRATGRGPCPLQ